MRESFVFHKDYICDLPQEYKSDFIHYTIDYGLYGKKPPLSDGTLEMALWAKIARRIDAESEKYKTISEKRREAAQRRYLQKCGGAEAPKADAPKNEPQITEKPKEPTAEKKTAATEKEKPVRFVKPTVEEIAAYCAERKSGIDAQAFFDFYESKGWKVGAAKMKDWRASVRIWEQRRKTEPSGGRTKAGVMWGKENEVPDEVADLF